MNLNKKSNTITDKKKHTGARIQASGTVSNLLLYFVAKELKLSYLSLRMLNIQEEIRGDGREREGRACLLAPSSLASHPLASCQLCCPFPSLSPPRQTGCQCRGGQHAPRTNTPTANFCSVFIYPFASCPGPRYKRQVNRWAREYHNEMHFPADELQMSIVFFLFCFLNGRLEGPLLERWSGTMADRFIKEKQVFIFAPLNQYYSPRTLHVAVVEPSRPFLMKHSGLVTLGGFWLLMIIKWDFDLKKKKKQCWEEERDLH